MIAVHPVLNGADYRHSADAYGERGGDERVDKAFVLCAAGFFLQPFAELPEAVFQIDQLADDGAGGKTDRHHDGAFREESAMTDSEHFRHNAADSEEQDSERVRCHQRFLYLRRDAAAREAAAETGGDDGRSIDQRSESRHRCFPPGGIFCRTEQYYMTPMRLCRRNDKMRF